MAVEVQRDEQQLELDLTGEWRALNFARIDAALAARKSTPVPISKSAVPGVDGR